MNNIIESIQQDILNPETPIHSILLKSKVLAHQLKNDRFAQWVKNEMEGYPLIDDVPDYRIFSAQALGNIEGRSWSATGIPFGYSSAPDWLKENAEVIKFTSGINTADQIAKERRLMNFPWPAHWIATWNHYCARNFQQLIYVERPVPSEVFSQIVATVRSRLLGFILEISDLPWNMGTQPVPKEQIERLVTVLIFNNQGAIMSTFDQSNQQVQSQINAARDVNIADGVHINNKDDLVSAISELRNLLSEVEPVKQAEVKDAIEVLESAAQGTVIPKGQLADATETIANVASMREKLEDLVLNAAAGIASGGVIEALKFVLS
jgi:hypothetical protein